MTKSKETSIVNIRTSDYDVYIGRVGRGQDGYFGNPIKLQQGQARETTLEEYEAYFYKRLADNPQFKQKIHELKGKILGCFCKPQPCHGDIIKRYLDII